MSYHTAFLVEGDERYGVGPAVLDLARGLAGHGHSSCVLAFKDSFFVGRCRDAGVDCRVLDFPGPRPISSRRAVALTRKLLGGAEERRCATRLAEVLREIDAARLVVRWPYQAPIAARSANLSGAQAYWMMPNIITDRWLGLNRWHYQRLCRSENLIPLPNSEFTGETLRLPDLSRVLYLGVDEQRFDPERVTPQSRSSVGIGADDIVLAVLARIHPTKGQARIAEALFTLPEIPSNVKLLLLGGPTDGEYADEIRAAAANNNASDNLILPGPTPTPEQYYGLADMVLNIRIDPEPFGLSVVEAMLMGKPTLVHALGGPAETVVDGVTGWHLLDPSVNGIRAALKRAFKDRNRWEAMGRAARERALDNFTTVRFAENYLKIVEGPTA